MSRKFVVVLVCLAMVAMAGTAVAQQKEPAKQFKIEPGKIILPGATKEALKALPKFEYAK